MNPEISEIPEIGKKFVIADKLHYLITDIVNIDGTDYYCVINENYLEDIDVCSLGKTEDGKSMIVPLNDVDLMARILQIYFERHKDKVNLEILNNYIGEKENE